MPGDRTDSRWGRAGHARCPETIARGRLATPRGPHRHHPTARMPERRPAVRLQGVPDARAGIDAGGTRGAGVTGAGPLIGLSVVVDPGKSYPGALCNKQRCIPTRRRRTRRLEGALSGAPFNLGNANPYRGFFRGSYSVSVTLSSTCDPQSIQKNTLMASEPSSPRIDETTLTKGQRRKLNALRKSVGDAIGEQAFVEWLAAQSSSKDSNDENAALIVDTLWPLVQQGNLAIPRGGYLIRRGRGRIIVDRVRA